MRCCRRSLTLAAAVILLLLPVLWYSVLPQPFAVVGYVVRGSGPSHVPNEPVRAEGRQFSTNDERETQRVPRDEVLPIPQTETKVRIPNRTEGRQFSTKYEIPWGGVLPIPETKTKVWIDIGTNINPIVAPSGDVYMILVDPIPKLVMNNEKAFPNPMDVAVVWSAISNTTGTAIFNVYNKNGKSSSLASAASYKASDVIEVPVHTLEELLNTIPTDLEIELLKTDMQGFDLVGLKSAGGSLTRVKMITSEFLDRKGIKDYITAVDNSMTAAAHYFKALGFSQLSCGKLDCQYQNVRVCKRDPSSCAKFQNNQRMCRQFTDIEMNLAKCKKLSVTPFRAEGDKCTICKPFG